MQYQIATTRLMCFYYPLLYLRRLLIGVEFSFLDLEFLIYEMMLFSRWSCGLIEH